MGNGVEVLVDVHFVDLTTTTVGVRFEASSGTTRVDSVLVADDGLTMNVNLYPTTTHPS